MVAPVESNGFCAKATRVAAKAVMYCGRKWSEAEQRHPTIMNGLVYGGGVGLATSGVFRYSGTWMITAPIIFVVCLLPTTALLLSHLHFRNAAIAGDEEAHHLDRELATILGIRFPEEAPAAGAAAAAPAVPQKVLNINFGEQKFFMSNVYKFLTKKNQLITEDEQGMPSYYISMAGTTVYMLFCSTESEEATLLFGEELVDKLKKLMPFFNQDGDPEVSAREDILIEVFCGKRNITEALNGIEDATIKQAFQELHTIVGKYVMQLVKNEGFNALCNEILQENQVTTEEKQ